MAEKCHATAKSNFAFDTLIELTIYASCILIFMFWQTLNRDIACDSRTIYSGRIHNKTQIYCNEATRNFAVGRAKFILYGQFNDR